MDIRTRLSLALVAVSLISMTALGFFAYTSASSLLQEISLRQLDALAESKRRDLNKVYDSWEDKLRLVRDRARLRRSLQAYAQGGSAEALEELQEVIGGVTDAVATIVKLVALDASGRELASAGAGSLAYERPALGEDIRYVGTFVQPDEGLRVVLSTPVRLKGQVVGGLEFIIDAADIFDVTSDYTGLGQTGEAIVFRGKGNGQEAGLMQVLNPLRYAPDAGFPEFVMAEAAEGLQALVASHAGDATGEHTDYRGMRIWSAIRYLPRPDWGLIVKVDVAEEEARAEALRESLVDIGLALSAFAIVGGALLGFYLARPISDLTELVKRMRQGEAYLRAQVKGDDEIAYLAESLNEFIDHLQARDAPKKAPDA